MKFILLSQEIGDNLITLIPVIFSDMLVHKSVFEINQMLLREMYLPLGYKEAICISAGFINFEPELKCYGESESLKISCRKGTTEIISQINYSTIFSNKHPFLCSEKK